MPWYSGIEKLATERGDVEGRYLQWFNYLCHTNLDFDSNELMIKTK
jgi:hypothetical protein